MLKRLFTLGAISVALFGCSHSFNYTQPEGFTCRHDIPRLEEDEIPWHSPTGADIKDYNGEGSGCAIYKDGAIYDSTGWHK